MKNVLLVLSSLIFAFALSVGLDRSVGLFQPAKTQTPPLIFPPNVEHKFRTREFSYTVQTNSLGFRDREFTLKKTAKTRVLAIGDSFTFGYGVNGDQAWPKVLEARLRAAGNDLEIANLGRPGSSPRGYAIVAEKAIPLLKPDLVIVAVLQGDDLRKWPIRRSQTASSILPGPKTWSPPTRVYDGSLRRCSPICLRWSTRFEEPQGFIDGKTTLKGCWQS